MSKTDEEVNDATFAANKAHVAFLEKQTIHLLGSMEHMKWQRRYMKWDLTIKIIFLAMMLGSLLGIHAIVWLAQGL